VILARRGAQLFVSLFGDPNGASGNERLAGEAARRRLRCAVFGHQHHELCLAVVHDARSLGVGIDSSDFHSANKYCHNGGMALAR
jgi:hypothetical protein